MATTRLQDDLLNEFREEKKMIGNQIALFEPLASSLRQPAAQRLANKGLIIIGELFCWACILSCIALCIFLTKMIPFYILPKLDLPKYKDAFDSEDVQFLRWSIYGFIGLIALLFLFLTRALRSIRLKNDILHLSGKHIKTLVGQHLQRKAAIDAIEQRHFTELPNELNDRIAEPNLNTIPNPDYNHIPE